jgi:hypothetical protein
MRMLKDSAGSICRARLRERLQCASGEIAAQSALQIGLANKDMRQRQRLLHYH